MQEVQDQLDFEIDTPSDEHIKRKFLMEAAEKLSQAYSQNAQSEPKNRKAIPATTKNQKKRARKAAKKARKVTT